MKKLFTLVLVLVLSLTSLPALAQAVPAEYVGDWAGRVEELAIDLSFTINADGSGAFAFEQLGYKDARDFSFKMDDGTFTLSPGADGSTCSGTFALEGEVLTLDLETVFANGRTYGYVVNCQRVAPVQETAAQGDNGAEDWLELNISTQEEADVLYEQYADAFNGRDVKLIVTGDAWAYMAFLNGFDFASLALDLPGSEVAAQLDEGALQPIPNLTELRCPGNIDFHRDMGSLRKLTLRFGDSDVDVLLYNTRFATSIPALEELSLHFDASRGINFSVQQDFLLPTTLRSLTILVDDRQALPESRDIAQLICVLRAVNPEATVNGKPISDIDETRLAPAEDASFFRETARLAAIHSVYASYADAAKHPGEPPLGQSMIFLVKEADSVSTPIPGESFYGFPQERMAYEPEQADTLVAIRGQYSLVGKYGSGAMAYATGTLVDVIDLKTGKLYGSYNVAYEEPPQSISVNEPEGRGPLMPDKAVAFILEKLGVAPAE